MTRISAHSLTFGMLLVLYVPFITCKKAPDPVVSKIEVSTVFESAERNAAYVGGSVKSNGVDAITERGVCWDTITGASIRSHIAATNPDTGRFTVKISDLVSGKTYFARAYARSATQTVYGNEINFTTKAAPIVATAPATNIRYNGCTSGGMVNGQGSEPILQKGVCWNTTGSPGLADQKTEEGPGDGSFTSVLENLVYGTQYYLRAYATTSVGTSYGPEVNFSTSPVVLPTITTNPVTGITSYSAVSGGNITSDGGAPVLERGVCWNYAGSQYFAGCTNDGTGSGIFTSTLNALYPFTWYGVRAFARNIAGTAYGQVETFNTPATQMPGPLLQQPAANAQLGCCSVNFSWSPSVYAEFYVLQLSTSPSFDGPEYSSNVACVLGVSTPSTTGVLAIMVHGDNYCVKMNNPSLNGTWYWRMRFFGAGTFSAWSSTRSFTFGM